MADDDPSQSGGLFIGRRPGSGPVHYKQPAPRDSRRRRIDNALANVLLTIELLLCLTLFGPQPAAWLWVGSQVQYLSGTAGAGFAVIAFGCMASLMLTMAIANRIDHMWKLVRRAAGHRQERGALERIFVVSVMVALIAFGIWLFIIQGPAPTLAPSQ